ncbi:MAG: hypothetical protein IJ035_00765 [Oscillospiraceae bacterium]|nr:hypothetical protein [Oscillospiraceae bacterium]
MKKLYAIVTAALLLCGCTQNKNTVMETTVSESIPAEAVTEETVTTTALVTTVAETISEATAYTMPPVPSTTQIEVGYSEDDEFIIIGREMWKQYNETLWDYFGTNCYIKWHYTNGEGHTNSTDARCYLEVDGLYTDRENEVYTEMNYAEAREFLINELNITEHGFDDLCRFSPGAYVEKDGKLWVGQADGGYSGWDFCYITDYKAEGDFVTYYCEKRGLYCNPDNGWDNCDRYIDFSFTLKNEDGEWKLYSCTNYEAFFMYLVGTAADVNEILAEYNLTVTLEKERDYLPNEEYLIETIEFIQGDSVIDYPFWNRTAYEFMNDFTLDSYSYSWIYAYGGYGVTLNCSDSTCEMFPNGESLWYFGNGIFCPWEKAEQLNSRYDDIEEPFRTAYKAAYYFSLFTGAFEFDEEWLENFTDIDVHGFYHAYNPYVVISEYKDGETTFYDVTPEEFAAAVKKLYNINMTAEMAMSMAGDDGFMVRSCGHGGIWYFDMLVGYEETDSEVKVTIDYYGDMLYFYPVLEVEYTFAKNDDGTITLQGAEKIFDKGYEPAKDSI